MSLTVEGLSVARGGVRVIEEAGFRIGAGEFAVIEGASGAGKTTLLRAIAGLLPYRGRIVAAGRPALVFQQHALAGRLSAGRNVLVGTLGRVGFVRATLGLWPAGERALAERCLAEVGLCGLGGRRAAALSGGQRQRVAIARALAQRSRVVLADEPVASLDAGNAEAVLTLLKELGRREGLAMLVSLHQGELARRFADRRFYLDRGRVREVA